MLDMNTLDMKTMAVLILICLWFVLTPSGVDAEDLLQVKFSSQPLFEARNIVPGFSTTSWVKVHNKTGQTRKVGAAASNVVSSSLASALEFTISEDEIDLYGGSQGAKTLADFFSDSAQGVYLSELEPYATTTYRLTVRFQTEAGNEYQNTGAGFDLDIGFFPLEVISEEAGGEAVFIAPSVEEIFNTKAESIASSSVTITWETDISALGRVVYDTQSHPVLGDAPDYGYSNFTDWEDSKSRNHSRVLSGLVPGTIYYYRTVSKASPEKVSKEYSFETLAVTAPPEESMPPVEEEKAPPEEGIGGPVTPPAEEPSFAEATEGEEKPAPVESAEEEEITTEEITTETKCLDAGYYWYDDACHKLPEEEKEVATPTKEMAKRGFLANLAANVGSFLAKIPWWGYAVIIIILACLYWFFTPHHFL